MEKGFISSSKAIKGYTESMIAKSENNDCVVRGHAFTIKDGVVIGNIEDGKKMKKHITGAWKIG